MKIVEVDDLEIRIEKQPKGNIFKWCIFCKVEKNKKNKLLFMIKSNKSPFLIFHENLNNIIIESSKIRKRVLKRKRSNWTNYLNKLKKDFKK